MSEEMMIEQQRLPERDCEGNRAHQNLGLLHSARHLVSAVKTETLNHPSDLVIKEVLFELGNDLMRKDYSSAEERKKKQMIPPISKPLNEIRNMLIKHEGIKRSSSS
jgi:hypothetical protein